ncbi:MAG: DedA family protein [Gemmatimonadales bacterium]|nr:DedA family protein [Gemmatimonadales bacterium]
MDLEHLVVCYGLVAVFLGAAVEGDLTLILAGVFAQLGYFPLPLALALGMLGSYVGDLAWFSLGRVRGPRFRASRFYRKIGPRIERLAGRVGVAQLIAARFVYGTKAASMVFWGLHGLPLSRFVIVDAIGCVLGSLVFTGLGYAVSGSAAVLLGQVRRVQLWLLGVVVVGVVLTAIIHWTAKRKLHMDDTSDEPP